MKWKSNNILYLIGIGIPLIITAILGILLAYPNIWVVAILAIVAGLLLLWLIKKIQFMPRPRSSFVDLTPLDLNLPNNYGVEIYTSPSLHEYSFMNRIVEILSPLGFNGQPPQVVVNPKILEQEGRSFITMAVTVELESYREKNQVRLMVQPVAGVLALISLMLAVFYFKVDMSGWLPLGLMEYLFPMLIALGIIGNFFFWNGSIARVSQKLDARLSHFFSQEEIVNYIIKSDAIERRGEDEKSTALNNKYLQERLNNLK